MSESDCVAESVTNIVNSLAAERCLYARKAIAWNLLDRVSWFAVLLLPFWAGEHHGFLEHVFGNHILWGFTAAELIPAAIIFVARDRAARYQDAEIVLSAILDQHDAARRTEPELLESQARAREMLRSVLDLVW